MEVVIGIVFSVVCFFFFMQNRSGRPEVAPSPMEFPHVRAQDAGQGVSQVAALTELPAHLPQESVLRRHFVTNVRQMIEDTSIAQPTESVLRRHYDQLIESRLNGCLASESHLQALIDEYEAFRKAA